MTQKYQTVTTEAFDSKRRELGEVKFSQTDINDPVIQKLLSEISKQHGVPVTELVKKIEDKMKEFDDIATKSPILYDTIKKNIVEQEAFGLLDEYPITLKAAKFDTRIFTKLMRFIKIEHDQFFPLRNFIDHKYLYNPVIILTPNPRYPQFKSVDTAAATPNGEFIFFKPFMQKLLDYAVLKGIKPKGKKYASNGGEIPDEYAYLEFLIIHEFMHYTYADFHYKKELKANMQVINWVGDFRTNYLLVKSGFEQLPIGLFNDHINYDRQKSYKEMYDIVLAEFKKLNKDQQQKVSNAMNGMGDDHSQGGGGESGESGEGSSGGQGGEEGEEGEDKNQGAGGEGEGKEGEDDTSGAGDGSDEQKDIFDELDRQNKEIEDKISNGKDLGKEPEGKKDEKKNSGQGQNSSRGGRGGRGDGAGSTFDYSKIRPTFSWKKLLEKMITDSTNKSEETYQKPHRRNITGVHLSKQTGAAAIKPGEIPLEDEIKLGFVIDSSGSMTGVIAQVYANINNLMKSKGKVNTNEFYLIKFSGSHYIYKCNFAGNKYRKVESVDDKTKNGNESGSVKDLFSKHIGSATNFDSKLTSDITALLKKRYNMLIVSDSDILYGENFTELKKLIMENKNLFVILDSRETFINLAKMMKQVPRNATYFE